MVTVEFKVSHQQAVVRTFKDLVTGEVIGFETTKYTGNIPLSEDGSKIILMYLEINMM